MHELLTFRYHTARRHERPGPVRAWSSLMCRVTAALSAEAARQNLAASALHVSAYITWAGGFKVFVVSGSLLM